MNIRNIPASIIVSPARVMRNAFKPACEGEAHIAMPPAIWPSLPTKSFFLS